MLQVELRLFLSETTVAYTINGIPITRQLFVMFLEVTASAFTYYCTVQF